MYASDRWVVRRWPLAAGSAVLYALVVLWLDVGPRVAGLTDHWARLTALRAEEGYFAQAADTRHALEDARRRLDATRRTVLADLPAPDREAVVFRAIAAEAARTGVRIGHWQPGSFRERETHLEQPVRLEAEGTFHDVGFFLDHIERLRYPVRVAGGNLEAGDSGLVIQLDLFLAFSHEPEVDP
jgi:Tfp pilus assembly protein PilO